MYHILTGILFILVICPALSQDRTNSPHYILKYISKIDSLSGEIDSNYFPEMKITFISPLGLYDTLDPLVSLLKGNTPVLPFSFSIEGKNVSYPEKAFFEISKKYRDTGYNKQRTFPWRYNPDEPVVNDSLLNFHVTCDRNYDSLHPAGTFLDDLVVVRYQRQAFNPSKHYQRNKTEIVMLLADYNENQDHTLLFSHIYWGLITPPSKEDIFTFTFIVVDETGHSHRLHYQPIRLKKEIGFTQIYY